MIGNVLDMFVEQQRLGPRWNVHIVNNERLQRLHKQKHSWKINSMDSPIHPVGDGEIKKIEDENNSNNQHANQNAPIDIIDLKRSKILEVIRTN